MSFCQHTPALPCPLYILVPLSWPWILQIIVHRHTHSIAGVPPFTILMESKKPQPRIFPLFQIWPYFCHASSLSLPWASEKILYNSLVSHVPLATSSLPSTLRRSCCPSWVSKRSCMWLALLLVQRGQDHSCTSFLGQPSWGFLTPTSHMCTHLCNICLKDHFFHTEHSFLLMVKVAHMTNL